jgi:hypothetical protein
MLASCAFVSNILICVNLCSSGAPRGVYKYKFKTYVDKRTTQPNLPFRLKPLR